MLSLTMTGQDRVNALLAIAFAPQAARSLSRAANSAKTAMVKVMAADLGARQSDIKRYVWTQPASATNLTARVYPQGKRGIPLIKLGATGPEPSRGQGAVKVKVGGDYPSAFIATMPTSGHRGVFQRKGAKRLPIAELRTAPIPDVFRRFRAVGVARAAEALKTNLVADLKFALHKRL
jgi:hypothetical protein